MEFSFFTTDNKSGYKTNEKWLERNHFELYNSIIEYCTNISLELNFKEKIWFYFHKLIERPKCVTCGSPIKFRNRFDKPYGEFCTLKCFNENKIEMLTRQIKTFNKKYNVNYYPEHKDFIGKQRKTKLIHYGDENYNNSLKIKETKLKLYGDEKYNNIEQCKITNISKYNSENYSTSNSYKNKKINEYKEIYNKINFIEVNKHDVKILCNECGVESDITKQLLYERYKRNYKVCVNCNPIGQSQKSGYEKELSEILKINNISHETSNRKILGKKEIDIFIESHRLGIEIDGVYWHNELFLKPNEHLNKTIECQNKNIDLIHIFEDEWLYKRDIVLSIIYNKIGLTNNRIYARKCVIKEIDNHTSKKFMDDNHIQGNVNSKIRIGLYNNDILVSVMTFSKGRIIMGGKSDEWELTRYSNLINTNVIGGANKCFNYFIKIYKPKKIISYSDIRLFKGGMYEKLGFKKISQSKPNYWYVKNNLRFHRFNYRKSILVKEGCPDNKTEKEIMFERKIYRIYDCGNVRWEWNF